MTTPSPSTGQPKPRFYQRTWVVVIVTTVLALIVGILVGMRGADATKSPEYKAQADKLEAVESELAFARASLRDAEKSKADAEGTAQDAAGKLETLMGQLDDRKAALAKRGKALAKAGEALDARKARLKRAEAAVRDREKLVTEAEELLAVTTIPGDGTYEVGADIEGGTYQSAGRGGCRYTVFGDAEGADVLIDNITAGAASVSLRSGTWFVTRGCAEWTRQ